MTFAYVRRMAKQKLFSMRMGNDEGDEFLAIIDKLRAAQRPQLSRTDMVKKLAFDADKKFEAEAKRK